MPQPIFHITHIDNLTSIITGGCIWCDSEKQARGINAVNIAHTTLKVRRSVTFVPFTPGGTLDDYTPFYFAPRSPMLYSINNDQVQGYTGGQTEIVHLVADAQAVVAAGLPFVFYDGHPVMWLSKCYNDLGDLSNVDWSVMGMTYWNDTPQYPDRKRRRMAEFLVHNHLPWEFVRMIGVIDSSMSARVNAILTSAAHKPVVSVKRNWYY